jgi:hypothetical protein
VLVEFGRDFDSDKFVAASGSHPHADQLPAAGRPLQFLIDLALDHILISAQAVTVF